MQTHTPFTISPQHLIPGLLLTGLLFLSYLVLHEFLLTLVWAFILAYVSWPLYQWLHRRITGHASVSAAIMTLLLAQVILVVVFWFATGMAQGFMAGLGYAVAGVQAPILLGATTALMVSTIDNVIRPLVISGASKIPFLVVMFGVLGGLVAFGVIGWRSKKL